MADNNPANFANLSKERVQEIAAKGGHASHGGGSNTDSNTGSSNSLPDRNPDGTFAKGSSEAKELGAQGGGASSGTTGSGASGHFDETANRNPDGTFKKGSKLASDLGAEGGRK